MKSFGLNGAHDVDIVNNAIQLVEGAELKRQSAECTINTKKGEWFFNDDLGIDFGVLLVRQKDIDEDAMKATILDGLSQVDDTFSIESFALEYDKKTRKAKISCVAVTADGDSITLTDVLG